MTDTRPAPEGTLARLAWPLRLTRAGMVAERAVRAFWPVWTIVLAVLAALAFGLAEALVPSALWAVLTLSAAGLLWTLVRGYRAFRWPTKPEALERLDRTMPGRPITALIDHPAFGAADPATRAVWETHVARMAARAENAHAPEPDLRISDRDPYALRFMAATAFAMALLFGGIWRVAEVGEAMAGAPQTTLSGPSWEGWVEPPLYTGKPSLYLNDIAADEFGAPAGSRITMRFYGEAGALGLRETIQNVPAAVDPAEPATTSRQLVLDRTGELAIEGPGGRSWQIILLQDMPPTIDLAEPLSGVAPGQMEMSFTAQDDYAVVSGQATFSLDLSAADRRHGLAVEPEPFTPLVLDLPMPFSGSRENFTEMLVEDLSAHPLANLPVILTLTARDHAEQTGSTEIAVPRLPGRRFFDPLANALVEQRRDLLWSRANADRAAMILRAVTHRPEGLFDDNGAYLMVRTAIRRLESAIDSISVETRDQVAELLWNAAILIEEGDLANALERLRRAQDRLSEAMRQGATDDEIAQLMEELREAMDEYMQQLAENAQPGEDQPDPSADTMELSMNDLEEMMRRIEELMQQGRMSEAQEMLDALRQLMENMQIGSGTDPNGPRSPGQQAMDNLQNTLRDQQGLSDESFSQLQDQFNPNGSRNPQQQPGDMQGDAEGGENDERSLSEQQGDLRRQLQEQAQNLPGRGTEAGRETRRMLDEAGRAMGEAAEALERGDLADALDSQSEAMEALRDGMGELGRALAEEEGTEPGQGQADGTMPNERPLRDPLGRQAGNSGAFDSDQSFEQREEAFRRARDLLDEIRRRSAEQERPDIELEYLRRLLDRF